MKNMVTYWYSKKHEEWLKHVYEFDGGYENTTVELNGCTIPYTTCRSDSQRNTEPYDRALLLFPDYVRVGECEGYPITIGRKGKESLWW
jgi:hypothetical protein